MKKFYLSTIIDCTFTIISLFLIFFVVFNCFFYKGLSIVLGALFTLAVSLPLLYFLVKKRKNFHQNALLIKNAEQVIFSLSFYTTKKLLALFEKALTLLNEKVENKETHLFLPEKNVVLFFKLGFEKVTKVDIVKAYNLLDFSSSQKVYVFAEDFENDVKTFANRFNGLVNLLNKTTIYKLLQKSELLNEIEVAPVYTASKKLNLKSFFTKKRAKSYLTSGIVFLTFSFFVFYKVYYIIVGCILLVLALVCIFIKNPEQENN